MTVINSGKTKQIIAVSGNDNEVDIISNSNVTAGDGESKDSVENKAEYATTTTCNIFRMLSACGVHSHYLERISKNTFRAKKCIPIQMECIGRRIATGSFLNRHSDVAEGFKFKKPVIEFFFKDDARHDPMMVWNSKNSNFDLFDAKDLSLGVIDSIDVNAGNLQINKEVLDILEAKTKEIFLLLESAWAELGVLFVDFKIEFGIDTETGKIILFDVIDNDSWRIWPKGDKTLDPSKQVYRDSVSKDSETLKKISKNYKHVAEQTALML